MDEQAGSNESELLELTSDIVSSFVSNNTVRSSELADLIASVHTALATIKAPMPAEEPAPVLTPAVSIKKSITDDFLVSLEDGRKFRTLKRHLSVLGMTPNEYRAKWGLPRDYPMVAPGYAAQRSELAKATGLGNSRRLAMAAAAEPPEPVVEPAIEPEPEAAAEVPAPKKRAGRPKKAA